MTQASSTDGTGDTAVVVTRTVPASPEEIYRAFTDSDTFQRWSIPPGSTAGEFSSDPRPGGSFRTEAIAPDGTRHVTTGVYRELVQNKKIVMSWHYDGPNWTDGPDIESQVTITLHATADGHTDLVLRHERLLPGEADIYRDGWTGLLDYLVKFVN